jgi:hypothetical protein
MSQRGSGIKDKTMSATQEQWKQIAIEIGHEVHSLVNLPNTIGTDDETGYILMFFNARNHNGKSTMISSTTDKVGLKKLLLRAMRELDGPKSSVVFPGSEH